jgi:hypothetical protein
LIWIVEVYYSNKPFQNIQQFSHLLGSLKDSILNQICFEIINKGLRVRRELLNNLVLERNERSNELKIMKFSLLVFSIVEDLWESLLIDDSKVALKNIVDFKELSKADVIKVKGVELLSEGLGKH